MGIAVVTGANSGIGRATAVRLAQDGHTTYGTMRDLDKGVKLAAAAEKAGVEVRPLVLDVTDDDSVATAFARVRDDAGPVDILVNNAGVGFNKTVEDSSITEVANVLDANVLGIVRCTKEVLADMRAAGAGCIVNVGSVAGRIAQPSMAAYSASKFAVEGLSEALAQEVVGFGIRVVLIEPGTIRTPIFAKSEPMPEGTAYEQHYLRTIAFFATTLADPTEPDGVADVISHAIRTDEPRFRYVVGPDAESILGARATMTDEDLIALSALDTDDYLVAYSARFGIDITQP